MSKVMYKLRCRIFNLSEHLWSVSACLARIENSGYTMTIPLTSPRCMLEIQHSTQRKLERVFLVKVCPIASILILVIECERILTAPYAPSNLNTYLTSNTQILNIIHRKTLPPSFPKALASLPSNPTKSISSFLSRSPKRRNRDTLDSVRSSAFDSPSTGSHSQSSDSISRTTNSSVEDGMVIGKRASIMFLGPETRERGVVTGVRSFVEGIRGKEWQGILPSSLITDSRC